MAASGGSLSIAASAAVKKEIQALAASGHLRHGIQVAAYLHGRPLVSVWGGVCPVTHAAVEENSLFMGYSVAKGVASTAMCLLAERAHISLDELVKRV